MERGRLPPLPEGRLAIDRWTEPFWRACTERRLTVAECPQCGTRRMPPTPFCPGCRGQQLRWLEVSGRGRIYTFTVVRRAILPGMQAHLPYAPAVISLEEYPQIRLISTVIDSDIAALQIDAPVSVSWHDDGDGQILPFFKLAP